MQIKEGGLLGSLGSIRKGQANVITILIISVLAIAAVVILWSITKNLIEKNSEDINLNKISDSIELSTKSSFIDNNLSLLQLNIVGRSDSINLTSLRIVANSNELSSNYIINDYPKALESKNYLLNISSIKDITEILVYPVLESGEFGLGKRLIIDEIKEETIELDPSSEIINPVIIDNNENICIPDWKCNVWDSCHVVYALEDISNSTNGTLTLEGLQERICIDNNNCVSNTIENKNCDSKIKIDIEKVNVCDKEYLEITDSNTTELISRLELIEGRLNIQFLLSNSTTKYYPYCFNNIKDCDEDEIDCVNENSGKNSCKICGLI